MIVLIIWMLNYCIFVVDSGVFIQDLSVVHVRDLNFMLRFEIFVHTDEQLQASHLILGVHPVYRTWKPFSQAISLDSPLLSYIDVRHANFLPPSLTTSEAWDLGPRYIITEDLAPLKDKLAKWVSRALRERGHVLIEENEGQVQAAPA